MLLFRPKRAYVRIVPLIGIVVGILVVAASFLLSDGLALISVILSLFIKAYKITVICCLFYTLIKAVADELKYSKILLSTVSFFGVALTVDMAVRHYEPILYGWPTEIGGFAKVCVLGAIITIDAIEGLRERISLAAKNEQLGMSYELLTQRIEQTKRNHHDLRHHMVVLSDYVQSRDFEKMTSYISNYAQGLPANEELHFSRLPAIDAVARYYYGIAKNDGVNVTVNMSLPEKELPEQDLCVLFGNLPENAIDACGYVEADKRYIHFRVTSNDSIIAIVSDNSCDGTFNENGGNFNSRKRPEIGIGTASIKAIAEKYDGYVSFCIKADKFQASVVLQI